MCSLIVAARVNSQRCPFNFKLNDGERAWGGYLVRARLCSFLFHTSVAFKENVFLRRFRSRVESYTQSSRVAAEALLLRHRVFVVFVVFALT